MKDEKPQLVETEKQLSFRIKRMAQLQQRLTMLLQSWWRHDLLSVPGQYSLPLVPEPREVISPRTINLRAAYALNHRLLLLFEKLGLSEIQVRGQQYWKLSLYDGSCILFYFLLISANRKLAGSFLQINSFTYSPEQGVTGGLMLQSLITEGRVSAQVRKPERYPLVAFVMDTLSRMQAEGSMEAEREKLKLELEAASVRTEELKTRILSELLTSLNPDSRQILLEYSDVGAQVHSYYNPDSLKTLPSYAEWQEAKKCEDELRCKLQSNSRASHLYSESNPDLDWHTLLFKKASEDSEFGNKLRELTREIKDLMVLGEVPKTENVEKEKGDEL